MFFTGSKDRLHRAKTIDLCQNPLTARIIVSVSSIIVDNLNADAERAEIVQGSPDPGMG